MKLIPLIAASVVTKPLSNQSLRSPRSSMNCSDPTLSASSRMPMPSIFVARVPVFELRTYAHTIAAANSPSGTLM